MTEVVEKPEPEIQEADEEEEELDFMEALRLFFGTYKDDIGTIIRAIGTNIERGPKMRLWAMTATFLMLALIIGILAYLTYLKLFSGEALAFLCGTIIGYLFSFMKTYVIGMR